jgi:hypothetical protein
MLYTTRSLNEDPETDCGCEGFTLVTEPVVLAIYIVPPDRVDNVHTVHLPPSPPRRLQVVTWGTDLLPALELEERSPPTPSLPLLRVVDTIHDPLVVMWVMCRSQRLVR